MEFRGVHSPRPRTSRPRGRGLRRRPIRLYETRSAIRKPWGYVTTTTTTNSTTVDNFSPARRRRRTDDEGSRGRAIVRSLEETSHPSRGLVSIDAGRSDVVVGGM